eukprot:gene1635-3170_t
MREIINIQVGQCGNEIGEIFWNLISNEHGIDSRGKYCGSSHFQSDRIYVYFNEGPGNRYIPRSILVDLDPGTLQHISASPLGQLFNPENFIYGRGSSSSNWAKGHYTDGAELIDPIMDMIRKENESCDSLQGFQLLHAIGGGTGSGLGTLIISRLREEYPSRIIATFSVIPSPKISDIVVSPYNAVLSMNELIEHPDECFIFDNDALYSICSNIEHLSIPIFKDLNNLICNAMVGITCSLRFPGQLNCDIRKLAVNMIPFPRLHFLMTSYAPVTSLNLLKYQSKTIKDLLYQGFDRKNMMCAINSHDINYLTCACMFRGKISPSEIDDEILHIKKKYSSHFVSWIPDNIKVSICDIPPVGSRISMTFIANSTNIQDVFRRLRDQFSIMLRKKAFLHWYTGEGMDEMQFVEAESNLYDLICEYQQFEEAPLYEDKEDLLYKSGRRINRQSSRSRDEDEEDEDDHFIGSYKV